MLIKLSFVFIFLLSLNSNVEALTGLNFEAPTVNGKGNVGDIVRGEIVFDISDSKFYGATNSSTWIELSNSTTTISEWASYTPTCSWTTNTTCTGMYRVVGDTLYIQVKVVLSGGAPNSSTMWVDIPSSYTIDSSKLVHGLDAHQDVGNARYTDDSAGKSFWGPVSIKNSDNNTLQMAVMNNYGTNGALQNVSETAPFTWADSDYAVITASVPVQ